MQTQGQAASVTEHSVALTCCGLCSPTPSRGRSVDCACTAASRSTGSAISLLLLFLKIVQDSRYAGAQVEALSLQRCHGEGWQQRGDGALCPPCHLCRHSWAGCRWRNGADPDADPDVAQAAGEHSLDLFTFPLILSARRERAGGAIRTSGNRGVTMH